MPGIYEQLLNGLLIHRARINHAGRHDRCGRLWNIGLGKSDIGQVGWGANASFQLPHTGCWIWRIDACRLKCELCAVELVGCMHRVVRHRIRKYR